MTPYKQGDLDGLCGIYAVVNGLRHVLDWNVRHYTDHDLFQLVAGAVPKADYPDVLWEGMALERLLRIARRATRYLAEEWNEEVLIETPFVNVEFSDLAAYLTALRHALSQAPSVALLGILWPKGEGGGGHWTALEKVTANHLYLLDSGGRRRLPLKNLRVRGERGLRLETAETVILRRRTS